MAIRGSIAKENVVKKIAEVFGADYCGDHDKKVYVWANDGGERIQVAISMTCPKSPVIFDATIDDGGDWDFSDTPKSTPVAVSSAAPAEITEQETENIATLLARLNL